ncbi:MAG: 2,3-bisphosphoglycerate-independent phosphoglycerate mutase [Candidatus Gastranaerophilales bacterium]|nr:2,3-bisphosphoglycerate-independent phosphoglycerate mutase [Candidatus Gastranaerophilales bacterium]
MNNKVILTIMDGWGDGKNYEGNAILNADLPNYAKLLQDYPHTEIYADGEHVGLPQGQMGNSEVGHLNLGAGRVVYQELTKINKSIKDGDFYENEEFLAAINHVKKNDSALHLFGLASEGGVHSSLKHLFALIETAKKNNVKKLYVHAFLDGRDTPPQSAVDFLAEIENKLKHEGYAQIASIIGRYYAMDRDNRWERVQKAYDCLTMGIGEKASNSHEGIKKSYENGINDEFVLPTVTLENSRIQDHDSIIFFNFRPDRAREITRALNFEAFDGFERKKVLKDIYYVCFTQYDEKFGLPIAFKPQSLVNILGEVLDKNAVKQFRTAETEKYAHVTFFFNGGLEKPFPSETRALVPSPSVPTYDLKPEMSAFEVVEKVTGAIESEEYPFILVNFANPDMVGHTGILEAAEKAVEAVDICIGKIVDAVKKHGFTMLLTADHGNAEQMIDFATGKPFTAHTTNPVPFFVINADKPVELREGGSLSDVAPTVLQLLGIEQPEEMTGQSLIR